MRYRYLDTTTDQLAAGANDIHMYCACGRYALFGPEQFAQWPGSSLHRIAARLRCTGCGARGNIPQITLSSVHARSGKCVSGDNSYAARGTPIQTTHQRRTSRRHRNWWLWVKCPACGRHFAPHVLSAQIIALQKPRHRQKRPR